MYQQSDILQSTLPPFQGTWDKAKAAHLTRRTHFGNKISDLNRLRAAGSAANAVQALINEAKQHILPDDPSWYTAGSGNVLDMYEIQFQWMNRMYDGAFMERMMLFWSNHFAVSYQNMNDMPGKSPNRYVSHMYKYTKLLQTHGLGDFRELVREVSKNSAMTYYLNNYNNSVGQPNEDFARELLELFTLGPNARDGSANYTENDVAEVARAVTGWRVNDENLTTFFENSRFDASEKTIFGQTGTYDLDGVIDLIFSQRSEEVAWFLSRKLYVYFVSAEPNNDVIDGMAAVLLAENFEISAVLQQLLSSSHFYEERFMGCRIKSPTEVYMAFLRQLEIVPNSQNREYIRLEMQSLNEELLRPDTVFGWSGYNPPDSDNIPGHYSWLNTNLMPSRWKSLSDLIFGASNSGETYNPIRIAEKVSDPSNPFDLAEDIAELMLAMPLSQVGVRLVDEDFAGNPALHPAAINPGTGNQYVFGFSEFPEYKVNLTKIMLGPIPWYEWTANSDGDGNLFFQDSFAEALRQYLSYLIQLPAYQLI